MPNRVRLNYKIIFHLMGVLLLFNGGFMLVSALVGYFYDDVSVALGIISSGLITLFVGMLFMFFF